LVEEASDFAIPPGRQIPRVHQPSTILFLRDFVGRNQPCIATGLLEEWPAMQTWQEHQGLCGALEGGKKLVSIDATPSGFGDAVIRHPDDHELVFVQPEKRRVPIGEFLTELEERDCDADADVLYLSHQNDNLSVEMPELLTDVAGEGLPMAVEAFGNSPDAVNLWIGDARAVSTMHRDNYENMYCVVKGEKVFDLLPPCCAPLLPMTEVRNGTYRKCHKEEGEAEGSQGWVVELDDDPSSTTLWTRFDIENEAIGAEHSQGEDRMAQADDAAEARRILKSMVCRVHVRAGEVLYLPAMW
jgi:jumonji domain-containing protein 7